MNILPFVCALLVIFGLLSTSLFRERLSLSNLKTSCQGSMRAERASRNHLVAAEYNKYTKKKDASTIEPEEPKPAPKEKKESPEVITHRDEKIFTTNTKLNLSPLFAEKNPLLHKTAATYIESLYANASFYKKGMGTQILDQLIAKRGALKESASFAELFPDDPTLREIFYKMLKGTGSYDLEKGQGFPPFENYFQLEGEAKSKPIHFRYAPTRLLRALFEDALTDNILKEESTLHNRLAKEKLTELLMQKNLNIQTFEPILSFSNVDTPKQLVCISDETSGVCVQTLVEVK